MSLTRAINDLKRILNDGGFSVNITMTPPNSTTSSIVKALAIKHHNSINTDGLPINAKNVHISLVEGDLTALNYTVRNSSGEVSLRNHRVSYADSTGVVKNYIIKETFPDETIGLITCILGDYGS